METAVIVICQEAILMPFHLNRLSRQIFLSPTPTHIPPIPLPDSIVHDSGDEIEHHPGPMIFLLTM